MGDQLVMETNRGNLVTHKIPVWLRIKVSSKFLHVILKLTCVCDILLECNDLNSLSPTSKIPHKIFLYLNFLMQILKENSQPLS